MTLRNALGGNVRGLFDQVNALLDSEDALIVFFDGRRLVSYANGFAASPSQLELLGVEIERSARNAVGAPSTTNRGGGRNREESNESTDRRDHIGVHHRLGRVDGGGHSRVADVGGQSLRFGDAAGGDRRRVAGRVLRLASETA